MNSVYARERCPAPLLSQAGGLSAISRWLSAAIPPENRRKPPPHPRGMPAFSTSRVKPNDILASLRDANDRRDLNRWCRCAQPPANGYDPFGINARSTQTADLASLRDANDRHDLNRWCRCAQPPANGYDPFGINARLTQTADLASLRLRMIDTTLTGGVAALNHRLMATIPTGSTHAQRKPPIWHLFGMRMIDTTLTGGVAALNHRLMATIPTGSIAAKLGQPDYGNC